ncbi:Myb-like_DNA-binding domain-containing protein [Hexamita inflata]|uniref:Myb-like DNA-binding domain-containing protein n=1 Tax=Hexamita inflata TaxID=28002 RepID=A0AA86P9L1_9EUKA|nr:Myb-like DNA-binding domain-containing protein [Hexamita inflata]CAI9967752.1 Myb-like DNA-binding domain-containing protein [Hexamita inflata]
MKNTYNFWTEQEINQLYKVARQNEIGGRVDWQRVQKQFPHRTKQQCKSYYLNIIKTQIKQNKSNSSASATQIDCIYQSNAQLAFDYIMQNSNIEKLQRIHQNFTVIQLQDLINEFTERYYDFYGCLTFILTYPNQYPFNYQLISETYAFLQLIKSNEKRFFSEIVAHSSDQIVQLLEKNNFNTLIQQCELILKQYK